MENDDEIEWRVAMDMMEKMARAMWPNAVDGNTGRPSSWALEKVRIAIETIYEPTEEMIKVGAETPEMQAVDNLIVFADIHGQTLNVETIPLLAAWRAMVKSILKRG